MLKWVKEEVMKREKTVRKDKGTRIGSDGEWFKGGGVVEAEMRGWLEMGATDKKWEGSGGREIIMDSVTEEEMEGCWTGEEKDMTQRFGSDRQKWYHMLGR